MAGWNGGRKGVDCGGRRNSTTANVTEVPEARLNRAFEDTQRVSIMLSSPNLIGQFAGRPGTLGKAVAHPAGGARRSERRPAAEVVKELLLSGSGTREDRYRVSWQSLLNSMAGDCQCFRD
jgi:hypothetical protein